MISQQIDPLVGLSKRERLIAEKFAEGLTYREIGDALHIAPTTVRTHLATIYRKLKIRKKAALINLVIKNSKPVAFQALPAAVEPIRVWPIPSGVGYVAPPPTAAGSDPATRTKPIVAVLPFRDAGVDGPDGTAFAEGVADDVATELSRFAGLLVMAPPATARQAESQTAGPPAAGTLGVDYVVEGSIRRAPGRIRLTVRLVEGQTGAQAWAERYDRSPEDIFAVQDEVVQSVVAALKLKVDESETSRTLRKPPSGLGAYECCLRGFRLYRDWRSAQSRAEARASFERATELDPSYARPWLGLGWLELLAAKWGFDNASPEALERAREYASRALECDPTDADCHWLFGAIHLWCREPKRAVAAYERARALNPSHSDLLNDLADSLTYVGRAEEAVAVSSLALRLNPAPPPHYHWNHAAALYLCRRYEDALAALQRMPDPGPAHRLLAATLAQLGRLDEAGAAVRRLLELSPRMSLSRFVRVMPYVDDGARELYLEGLRKAGLPE